MDTASAYEHVVEIVFRQSEEDIGHPLTFAHMLAADESKKGTIQAILIDMHAGQAVGIQNYFKNRFGVGNGLEHITSLVKICRVHYRNTIVGERRSLRTKGVKEGICSNL
jgi:hypothetical protein